MKFTKTRFTNIIRSERGIYFMRIRCSGRLTQRSLKTDIEREAVTRYNYEAAKLREKSGTRLRARSTVGGLLEAFLERSKASHGAKPRTKEYHVELVDLIRREWLGIDALEASKVSAGAVQDFFKGLRREFSATRFNGVLQVFRAVFSDAQRIGARNNDPTEGIERQSVSLKPERVPSSTNFARLLEYLKDSHGAATWFVRFLAFSGARLREADALQWSDVDESKARIHFRAETTKSGKERYVPIIADMAALLKEMRPHAQGMKLLPISAVDGVLKRACLKLGIPRFSHHDLRHLFATRCIESGVDIPTVSRWLGHQDGGALAMRVYGHLRDDHSREQAGKVKF